MSDYITGLSLIAAQTGRILKINVKNPDPSFIVCNNDFKFVLPNDFIQLSAGGNFNVLLIFKCGDDDVSVDVNRAYLLLTRRHFAIFNCGLVSSDYFVGFRAVGFQVPNKEFPVIRTAD